MKTTRLLRILLGFLVSISFADGVWGATFGVGANQFAIDFVMIGNAGNLPDNTGNPNPVGGVAYDYRIGKYEISEQMIEKANALGGLGIDKNTRAPNMPATSVSWNEAARFVNWLNTSKGFAPAYQFAFQPGEVGYNKNDNAIEWAAGVYRNPLARFFLPNTDEWYKAAYYDGDNGVYYNYPTGSDAAPATVAGGTGAGTAVWTRPFGDGPAEITNAGGLSPYGTMAQGGNVFELEETDHNLVNGPPADARGLRGGYWSSPALNLQSTNRLSSAPANQQQHIGFRVAAVIPEPSTLVLVALAGLGLLCRRTR